MKSLLFLFILPISLMSEAYGFMSAKIYEQPLREFSVILTEEGYYPNNIVAFEGERIKFFLTSTIDKPECLIVEDHKIFLEATKGKVTQGESVFKNAGEYKFYCPSSKYKGLITVLKKPEKENKDEFPSREIASEGPGYWLPRDHD